MATYSNEDFERIAAAIRVRASCIEQYEKKFEEAAMWYRLGRNAREIRRTPPAIMRKRMMQIANAARKLLRHLDVRDQSQAADGPGIAVLQALASADPGNEDAVVRATARIGRLVEILEARDAVRELERRAEIAGQEVVRIGKLVVPKGHQGDADVNDWIEKMMSIYKQITGKDPRFSVLAPGKPDRGKAAGPLIRFLKAAGKPLGIQLSSNSFAGRSKDIRTGGRRRQK